MAVVITVSSGTRDTPPRTVVGQPAASLLAALQTGGVDVTATCGGRGRCTSCRVQIVSGAVPPPTIADEVQLGDAQVREGYRLACQLRPTGSLGLRVAPPVDEQAFQILSADPAALRAASITVDAGVHKETLTVALPRDEHHQTADVDVLLSAIGRRPGDLDRSVLTTLPTALREDGGTVTVTTFGHEVLDVERGDTAAMRFGLAVDIGTTTVVTTLLELQSGETLASVSSLNPQATFGADLMSRIAYVQFNPAHLRRLHGRILRLLNQHVDEVCRQSGVLARWIYKVVVVGNTCMHHLVLGIDPSWVGLAPYAPVMSHPLVVPARDLFLRVAPGARVCLLPLVAGFVGADAVAVALATRLADSPDLRIAVDIGTNGEVLLGSRTHLWACSAPAGPALEGAQIRHGMRAARGAIDRVTVDDDLHVHTIGEAEPLGICGSGLVDLLAGLLDARVIDPTGLIRVEDRDGLPPRLRDRVIVRGEERQVIVLRAGECGAGREIVLTQEDVRQLQLAKGAIASGITLLMHVAGVTADGVTELMLAGGFGNYVSLDSAVRIGLVPPLPLERIRYVGNAASLGAQLCLLSEAERARAADIARAIEHVPLATHPAFEEAFIDGMSFPGGRPGQAR